MKSHASLAFGRVLRKRCPRCGRAGLFERYARLHAACPACGHRHRRESGASTGSMYVSAAVTQLFAVGVVVALWLLTDWPMAASLATAAVTVLAFSYAFLPYSMAIWVAVEYWTDLSSREAWAVPPEPNEPSPRSDN